MINSPVYPPSNTGSNGYQYDPPYRQEQFNRIAPALMERFKADPSMQATGMPTDCTSDA